MQLLAKNFVLLLTFLICNALTAWATSDGPDCWLVHGVAKNDVLNIRALPGLQSTIIGKIPANTPSVANTNDIECPDVPVAGMPPECGSGWCKVTYKSVTGWVKCSFLEASTDCD